MPRADVTNVVIAGVGGQGIILASDVLARAAVCAGRDVKRSEIHGMAQRGGSVTSEIRFGRRVWSPVIADGEVDVLVALEILEAARHAHRLRKGGAIIASSLRIRPAVRPPGAPPYPLDIDERLRAAVDNLVLLDAPALAAQAGNARAANTVLLGALSCWLDLPPDAWRRALEGSLRPQLLDANLRAFDLGRRAAGRPA
jgi:indolepyruvate ferredoxin oxidoreductase beta subunit